MLPVTMARVPKHSPRSINRKIRIDTEDRVAKARLRGPDGVHDGLADLRQEWDIERAVAVHSGVVALGSAALIVGISRRFAALPAILGLSLLAGALFGVSPQYAILRRLGFRTAGEIERERNQLLAEAKHAMPASTLIPSY